MSKHKKNKPKPSKKKANELTYFLDHPQIQRHPCVGNQDPKPSLGAQIGFPGMKGSTVTPSTSQPKQSAPATATTSSKPSIMQQINWGGKYKK